MSRASNNSITTAALLTPPGVGGIAVIKIAGESIWQILTEIFNSVNKTMPVDMKAGRCYLGHIMEQEETIDQVMLLIDPKTNSAEIHCHGGPRIIQRIMLLLQSRNIAIIDTDLQNHLDSISSEQNYYLAKARTSLAVSMLACQFPGGLYQWCHKQIQAINSPAFSLPDYQYQAKELLQTFAIARRLIYPVRVALIGPPNAGKSSLANILTGRKQSLVSDLAGTTRDWTSMFTDMAGVPVELIDTAGWRESNDELEMMSLRKLQELLGQIDLAILLIPANDIDNFNAIQAQQTAKMPQNLDILTVISKADQLYTTACSSTHSELQISSLNQCGLEALKQSLKQKLGIMADFDFHSPAIFTTRQYHTINTSLTREEPNHIAAMLSKCIGDIN
ncbi:MAG: 50S ribosome-binding GTPase [Sedimentisphaerales bacterium]|nr:50S ribosome-binding GTPase [Sedimentisphaerales bacterium]MBN2843155.1 50S ribosome-binding GTPase [Sedimentisphaerales bacterium]